MNVIATGDENGIVYEKQFLPEINQLRKENTVSLLNHSILLIFDPCNLHNSLIEKIGTITVTYISCELQILSKKNY